MAERNKARSHRTRSPQRSRDEESMITFIRRNFRLAAFLVLVAVLLTIAAITAITAYLTRSPLRPTESVTREEDWNVRNAFLPYVVEAVPGIVETQDRNTGRFG